MALYRSEIAVRKVSRCVLLFLGGYLSAPAQTPTPTLVDKPKAKQQASPSPRPIVVAQPTGGATEIAPPQNKVPDTQKPATSVRGSIEILSDTMGVDFGPYLRRLHVQIEDHWFPLIPDLARPPIRTSGSVVLEFAIMQDGTVQGLTVIHSSGTVALDRAAYGGILNSAPLPRSPAEFNGGFLRLRCNFLYNPDNKPVQAPTPEKK
jgi:TonB family protein